MIFLSILAAPDSAIQAPDFWTRTFSIIAALGGLAGFLSAVYTAQSVRKKADRDFLIGKLETLYTEVKNEVASVTDVIKTVGFEYIEKQQSFRTVYDGNKDLFLKVWLHPYPCDLLVTFYFKHLRRDYQAIRDSRLAIMKEVLRLRSEDIAWKDIDLHYEKLKVAHARLRAQMNSIAGRLAPKSPAPLSSHIEEFLKK